MRAALAVALALGLAPSAAAQTAGSAPAGSRVTGALTVPATYDRPPAGRSLSANRVIAIARAHPRIRTELSRHRGENVRAFLARGDRWQVSWYVARRGERTRQIAQVHVDDSERRVLEAWTGFQVEWTMARGYPGAFGRAANAPYVWIPLCLLFLLPFARPPLRMLHLDLLALLAFSAGYAFHNDAQVGVSVHLAYPLLLYLLARMLWVAWRRPARAPATWMSEDALGIAIVFLLGFRLGLDVVNSNVIDVGYSGVIGADRIAHGEALYGNFPPDNPHGDTYGPVNYLLYVPFELVWPWKGTWDALPAAHAAAIAFDLACALVLAHLGRRYADRRTGLLLVYLWFTFPFALLTLASNANDALVGALVLAALAVHARPLARGAMTAFAGLTKLAPLALAPLLWAPGRTRFAIGFAAAAAVAFAPLVLGGGLDEFRERTLAFQDERESPFSVWGQNGGVDWLQELVQWGGVAFAASLAFVRRPPDLVATAALAAAVLIALQLAISHWFYLYLAWFVPALLVALLIPRGAGPARSSPPAAAASSG